MILIEVPSTLTVFWTMQLDPKLVKLLKGMIGNNDYDSYSTADG